VKFNNYINMTFCPLISPCANGRIRTLYFRIISQVLYYCVNGAQPSALLLGCL